MRPLKISSRQVLERPQLGLQSHGRPYHIHRPVRFCVFFHATAASDLVCPFYSIANKVRVKRIVG